MIRPPFDHSRHGVLHVLVRIQRRVRIDDLAGRRDDVRSAAGVRDEEELGIVGLRYSQVLIGCDREFIAALARREFIQRIDGIVRDANHRGAERLEPVGRLWRPGRRRGRVVFVGLNDLTGFGSFSLSVPSVPHVGGPRASSSCGRSSSAWAVPFSLPESSDWPNGFGPSSNPGGSC